MKNKIALLPLVLLLLISACEAQPIEPDPNELPSPKVSSIHDELSSVINAIPTLTPEENTIIPDHLRVTPDWNYTEENPLTDPNLIIGWFERLDALEIALVKKGSWYFETESYQATNDPLNEPGYKISFTHIHEDRIECDEYIEFEPSWGSITEIYDYAKAGEFNITFYRKPGYPEQYYVESPDACCSYYSVKDSDWRRPFILTKFYPTFEHTLYLLKLNGDAFGKNEFKMWFEKTENAELLHFEENAWDTTGGFFTSTNSEILPITAKTTHFIFDVATGQMIYEFETLKSYNNESKTDEVYYYQLAMNDIPQIYKDAMNKLYLDLGKPPRWAD